MNLKKFKKSLVSIVLGSSLFLVNGGVICQQPKAWLPDEFINSEIEKYQKFPEMLKIINVLKFFSDLHEKPEYAGALSFIHTSSLSRLKYLSTVRTNAVTKKLFQVSFTRAMVAATAPIPSSRIVLQTSDGKTTKNLPMELLFEHLNLLCSDCGINPVTTILQDELTLILSIKHFLNLQEIQTRIKEKTSPEEYTITCNQKIELQLEDLLPSAIELLSE